MNSENLSGSYGNYYGGCLFLWLFLPAIVCGIYIAFCADVFYGFVYSDVPSFQGDKLFRMLYFALPFGFCAFAARFRVLRSILRVFVALRGLVIGFVFYSVFNCSSFIGAVLCVGIDFLLCVPVCELFDRGCAFGEDENNRVYVLIDILLLIVTCAFILII